MALERGKREDKRGKVRDGLIMIVEITLRVNGIFRHITLMNGTIKKDDIIELTFKQPQKAIIPSTFIRKLSCNDDC